MTAMRLKTRTVHKYICVTSSLLRMPRRNFADASATAMQTINVKKRIENTRAKALEGGGKRRIDNQHKKVCNVNLFSFSLLLDLTKGFSFALI